MSDLSITPANGSNHGNMLIPPESTPRADWRTRLVHLWRSVVSRSDGSCGAGGFSPSP